ncbi:hypothetical protein [Pseudomonas sp. IT-P253]|uniref:hypothetical protein n=1 Tax=Pseudomonas sp. IT-P253 TaxID=3026455 RepID=UPI0039E0FD7D
MKMSVRKMDENSLLKFLQICFWGASLFFVIFGIFVTIVGWTVNGNKAKQLAKKKDAHEAIDKTLKSFNEFEDAALSFWAEKDSKIKLYQLVSLHQRAISNLKQLLELKSGDFPISEIKNLRKECTLDAETATRPIPENDIKIRKISHSVQKIASSQLLIKTWK